jgi:hypothetical protein
MATKKPMAFSRKILPATKADYEAMAKASQLYAKQAERLFQNIVKGRRVP